MARKTNHSVAKTTINIDSTRTASVLRRREAAAYIGLSTVMLDRLAVTGEGPPKCRLTGTAFGYRVTDLDKWLADRVERVSA